MRGSSRSSVANFVELSGNWEASRRYSASQLVCCSFARCQLFSFVRVSPWVSHVFRVSCPPANAHEDFSLKIFGFQFNPSALICVICVTYSQDCACGWIFCPFFGRWVFEWPVAQCKVRCASSPLWCGCCPKMVPFRSLSRARQSFHGGRFPRFHTVPVDHWFFYSGLGGWLEGWMGGLCWWWCVCVWGGARKPSQSLLLGPMSPRNNPVRYEGYVLPSKSLGKLHLLLEQGRCRCHWLLAIGFSVGSNRTLRPHGETKKTSPPQIITHYHFLNGSNGSKPSRT